MWLFRLQRIWSADAWETCLLSTIEAIAAPHCPFSGIFVQVACGVSPVLYTNRHSQVSVNNSQTAWGVMAAPVFWCCTWIKMRECGEKEGGLLSIKFWYPARQLHFIIINRLYENWGFFVSQHNREARIKRWTGSSHDTLISKEIFAISQLFCTLLLEV